MVGELTGSPAVNSARVTRLVVPVCASLSASGHEPSARCCLLQKVNPVMDRPLDLLAGHRPMGGGKIQQGQAPEDEDRPHEREPRGA